MENKKIGESTLQKNRMLAVPKAVRELLKIEVGDKITYEAVVVNHEIVVRVKKGV